MSFRDEPRQNSRIWGDNPEKSKDFEEARNFAFEQELKACQDRSSGSLVMRLGSLLRRAARRLAALRGSYGFFWWMDRDKWWERLRRRARAFNRGIEGYELEVLFLEPENAVSAVENAGLQAIGGARVSSELGPIMAGYPRRPGQPEACWRNPGSPARFAVFGLTGQSADLIDKTWMVDPGFFFPGGSGGAK